MRISVYLTLCISALLSNCKANTYKDPQASLDYGVFRGRHDETYNLTYFRKIPFAAPPVGENRFRAPQPPLNITEDVYNTDQEFDMCPQRTVNGSEDCLYLGLFSRPWNTTARNKRPVLVVFYGGAFIQGSASFSIPPPSYPMLNVSDMNDYVVVYPNYRVNAFGFLPGKAVKESSTSDLNAGLLDQQFALKWVRKYIHHFGGDPNNVTVWGQSAGAGSVVAQVLANGRGKQPKLFSKALMSSPFWPKTYSYDAPEAEDIYDKLVNSTGCSSEPDSLACLKQIDVQTIRNASLVIADSHTWTTSSYTWAPVIDGVFLFDSLTEATARGPLNTEHIFGMYNTHEGENFVPSGLADASSADRFNSSATSFRHWLTGFLPRLSAHQVEWVERLYPPSGRTETIDSYTSTFERAGLIYRDLVLACPAFWIASSAKGSGYLGEYTISPARHGSDTIYVRIPFFSFFYGVQGLLLNIWKRSIINSNSGTGSTPFNSLIRSFTMGTLAPWRVSFKRVIQMHINLLIPLTSGFRLYKGIEKSLRLRHLGLRI